jgi:L-aspartate oxidase
VDEGPDDPGQHAEDTLAVGGGLCDVGLVRGITREAKARIEHLVGLGARFDAVDDASGEGEGGAPSRARGLEAAHSHPRVLHARGDATGAEIRDVLASAVLAQPRIERWGDAFLVDLLTDAHGRCRGALVLTEGRLRAVWAGAVVLATGGYGQVYRESSNWPGATGDGVAAAWRAGAPLQDLEFVQFHPTTLYLAGVPRLLITEAVRGEGAWIVDDHGRRFVSDADPRGELAPRDVISRAITRHLQRPEVGGVFLDLRHLDPVHMARRFPGVARSCRSHGLDFARDLIPIRPAAHYTIGGVSTDAAGATRVEGLYAAGEVACTGLHGANRLASNSLLEGVVMGRRAGEAAAAFAAARSPVPAHLKGEGTGSPNGLVDVEDLRVSLKALMWREAGIERTGAQLIGAQAAIGAWERFAHGAGPPSEERLALLNMLCVARLVAASALLREESRGTHYRRDFPEPDDERWRVHIVHRRDAEPELLPVADGAARVASGATG